MPSINIDVNLFDNIKVTRLTVILGPAAVVSLIRLWCFIGTHFPEAGGMDDWSAEEVEAACHWSGQKGLFVATLLKLALLHEWKDGYKVHDWKEHAAHLTLYTERAKKGAQARWAHLKSSRKNSKGKELSKNAKALLQAMPKPCLSNANTIQYNNNNTNSARAYETDSIDGVERIVRAPGQDPPVVSDRLLKMAQDVFGPMGEQPVISAAYSYPEAWIEAAIQEAAGKAENQQHARRLLRYILARYKEHGGPESGRGKKLGGGAGKAARSGPFSADQLEQARKDYADLWADTGS